MCRFQRRPEAVCPVGAVFPVSREIVVSEAIGAALLVCELEGYTTRCIQRMNGKCICVRSYLGMKLG